MLICFTSGRNLLERMIPVTSVWLWCDSATRGRWFDQPFDPAGMFSLHSPSFSFSFALYASSYFINFQSLNHMFFFFVY